MRFATKNNWKLMKLLEIGETMLVLSETTPEKSQAQTIACRTAKRHGISVKTHRVERGITIERIA